MRTKVLVAVAALAIAGAVSAEAIDMKSPVDCSKGCWTHGRKHTPEESRRNREKAIRMNDMMRHGVPVTPKGRVHYERRVQREMQEHLR